MLNLVPRLLHGKQRFFRDDVVFVIRKLTTWDEFDEKYKWRKYSIFKIRADVSPDFEDGL